MEILKTNMIGYFICFAIITVGCRKKVDQKLVFYAIVDRSIRYPDGSILCLQKAKLYLKNLDTITKRDGDLQIFLPDGRKWITYSETTRKTDSTTVFHEDGSIERTISMRIDTVNTFFFIDNRISHKSQQLGLFSERIAYRVKLDGGFQKALIVENGHISYIYLNVREYKADFKFRIDYASGLLKETKSIDFSDPLAEPDYEPDFDDPF
jgi:hypothetical protein